VKIVSVDDTSVTVDDQNGREAIPLADLPLNLQRKVRYAAAKMNGTSGPAYFLFSDLDKAQALARQLQMPLAWVCAWKADLTATNSVEGSTGAMLQMALAHLQGQAIVIFVAADGGEWEHIPPPVLDLLHHMDDGPLPDGHHFLTPKLVFSNADATQALARVSNTQMTASGKGAIDAAITTMESDPSVQAGLQGQPAAASTPSSPPAATGTNSAPFDVDIPKME
jgi:hypothetical protein